MAQPEILIVEVVHLYYLTQVGQHLQISSYATSYSLDLTELARTQFQLLQIPSSQSGAETVTVRITVHSPFPLFLHLAIDLLFYLDFIISCSKRIDSKESIQNKLIITTQLNTVSLLN